MVVPHGCWSLFQHTIRQAHATGMCPKPSGCGRLRAAGRPAGPADRAYKRAGRSTTCANHGHHRHGRQPLVVMAYGVEEGPGQYDAPPRPPGSPPAAVPANVPKTCSILVGHLRFTRGPYAGPPGLVEQLHRTGAGLDASPLSSWSTASKKVAVTRRSCKQTVAWFVTARRGRVQSPSVAWRANPSALAAMPAPPARCS